MNLTENTKVRIRVPKHLYESIQAELAKQDHNEEETMEEGEEMKEYVGMSPDQAQVVEILGSLIAAGGLGAAVKTALQMAVDKIKSKKSGGEEKGDINEYVGMSPDQAQVVEILGSLIAAGGLGAAVKTALQMAMDKIKSKKSGDAQAKEPVAEVEEMEEAFDFNTLMEAVKDLSKKKADEKKKKEAEAKKKKEAEDKKKADEKKKKEAEAKKKADAAKKK
jgi:methylglyoxal synthase